MSNSDQALHAFADYLAKMTQSSLQNFVGEITVKRDEITQASQSYQYISGVLKTKGEEEKTPHLISSPTFLIGSYPRGTKISPLNDIDIFLVLHALGTTYLELSDGILWYHHEREKLISYTTDEKTVNSVRVLNSIKKALEETYSSEISRNQQAVTVKLESYNASIDIVPVVKVADSDRYIIPAGKGDPTWKFSDPLLDAIHIDEIHAANNDSIKPMLKIVKYWNREHNRNKLRTYHIEAAAYHIFRLVSNPAASILDTCYTFFADVIPYLYDCPDPTGCSEPISGYLPDDYLDRIMHEAKIQEAKNAAAQDAETFIKFLRKEV